MVDYFRCDLKAAKKRRTSSKQLLRLYLFTGGSEKLVNKQQPRSNSNHSNYSNRREDHGLNASSDGGVKSGHTSCWGYARSLHYCNSHTENFCKAYRRNTRWWRKRKLYTNRRKSKKKRLWRCRVKDPNGTSLSSCPDRHTQPYRDIKSRTFSVGTKSGNDRNVCYKSGSPSKSEDDDDQTMMSMGSGSESTSQSPILQPTTTTTTIGSTAASVFRNCCGGGSSSSSMSIVDDEMKVLFQAFVAKLTDLQISTLCHVAESGGSVDGRPTDCILIQRETIMNEDPNVIACRLWRWPDVKSAAELKRIPSCPNSLDPVYICCNPYHWSRLCCPDTPPPPYEQFDMDSQNVKGPALNESIEEVPRVPESLPTDGEDKSHPTGWCELAYWERSQRVGERFPVENSSVNVFFDQPRGDGMCLKILSDQRTSVTPDDVSKAREKIGLGITLSQETDSVWLYNRSSEPIFIHSPTLNNADGGFHVSKVQSGYCLKAYNYRAMSQTPLWPSRKAGAQTGPVDTFSMRISFVKGWGRGYSRQDVTSCPCWLEVLLTRR